MFRSARRGFGFRNTHRTNRVRVPLDRARLAELGRVFFIFETFLGPNFDPARLWTPIGEVLGSPKPRRLAGEVLGPWSASLRRGFGPKVAKTSPGEGP